MLDNSVIRQMSEKSRIEFIDLAKGFCILLVVLTHVHFKDHYPQLMGIHLYLKSFRMPLYFMLSGLFFKEYEGFIGFLKRKTNKLLIPFIFFFYFNAIIFRYIMDFTQNHHISFYGIKFYINFYYESFNDIPGGIWFLLCLFNVNIIFYIIYLVVNRNKLHSSFIFFFALLIGTFGYYIGINQYNLPLFFDSAMTATPFFAVGYILKRDTNFLLKNRMDKYNWIFIIFSFFIVYLFFDFSNYMSNYYKMSLVSTYISGIAGTIGVLLLSKKLVYLPIVSYLGRYSIIVLCTHQIMIIIVNRLLRTVNTAELIVDISTFLIVVLLSLFIIPLLKQYLPYVTAQKDLLPID